MCLNEMKREGEIGVGESCHLNSFVMMTMVEADYEESICTTHPLLPVCQSTHLLKIRLRARDTSRLTASLFSNLGGKKQF